MKIQHLENWLGIDKVKKLSDSMLTWYGPPIAIQGVPGNVMVHAGGNFSGRVLAGSEVSAIERAETLMRKSSKARRLMSNILRRQAGMAGFASLSDLISEATAGGKRREFLLQKAGSVGVTGVTNSLWGVGAYPVAGANASGAPGGDITTSATTGAYPFDNVSPDTRHFVYGAISSSVTANTLLLYDRLFQVNTTMNSVATEAVTGVPTRYQSIVATDPDYIGGNFLFVEVGGTALAATAHNWTVCTYLDQANAASTLPSLTGSASAIVRRLDHPTGQWFAPLAAGDVGVKALTQMQNSAAVLTGVINFVIGHPIAFMPCPAANLVCVTDGINTAFNLVRVFDNAAMGFLEVTKPGTTSTSYTGSFTLVHG